MELKEYKLGDIAEIVNGSTPTTTCPHYYDGDIVWITPKDLSEQKSKYIEKGERNITEAGFNSCSTHLIPKYNILLTSRAPIGLLAINKVACCTNQGFKNLIINKDIVDVDYLYYYLKYHIAEIEALGTGTTFKEVSKVSMEKYTVSLPDLEEQKKVSSILSALDAKISLNRQINQNLEALARQLYDYWFVQFDFPNEEGKPYKSSGGKMVYNPILKREIPEGWEVKEMEEIIDIKSGFPFQSTTYLSKGKYSIITIKNVQDGFLDLSGTDFLDELPPRIPDYCILKRGDILISLTGNIGRVGRVFSDNLLLNQRVGYVDCKNQYNNWAYLYITSSQVRLQIEKLGIGSAQLNVSPIQIGKIKLALPTDQVLSSFDKKLAAILEHILANSNEIASLTKQRDELLPLLMNGQVNFDLSDD